MKRTITHTTFGTAIVQIMAFALIGLSITGCRNELYDQEYGEPLEESKFFADKRMARPLVEGTVSRGDLREDELQYTGRENGAHSTRFPMEVTRDVMARGQQRFNIYCAPCHGNSGHGDGIIVQRGMKKPPSFHEQRLVDSPPGYFFEVITNGFGVMYSYASRVKPEDRWAIAAYVKALQKAGGTQMSDTTVSTATTPMETVVTESTTDTNNAATDANDNQ